MVCFRTAGPGDAAMVASLARRTFTETFGHLYRANDLAAFLAGHSEEAWRSELSDCGFAVRLAEHDSEAIGYAKLGPPSLPFDPRGPSIELRQFYLLQPWHGQGIAHHLMRWALGEARARGAADIYLSVFVDNHRARRFYQSFGFEAVGTYAFMVGEQADEDHVMRLHLGDTM